MSEQIFMAERQKMLKTIERQNEYIRILTSLTSAYETALTVNLKDYSFKVLVATDAVRKASKNFRNVLDVMRMYGEFMVKPEYQELFYSFLDPLTLSDRLVGQKYLTADYDTKNLGWVHARLIPCEYDLQGNIISAIFTTECTEEYHKENVYLRHASETDGLTGLMNRTKGQDTVETMLKLKKSGLFMLLDINQFRNINETLSHLVGDKVLIALAEVLRNCFGSDNVFRLFGDKFAVFKCDDEMSELMEKGFDKDQFLAPMLEDLKKIDVPELDNKELTVSVGMFLFKSEDNATFEKIYQQSDEALLQSKKEGNGTVTVKEME